tara:strand:+ start:277 stop:1389 length:1113 start_codon:yes stop_codon:yes gene_type:complete
MPNPLKFSGSGFNTNILDKNHLRSRNLFIGTIDNYGPSNETGWYNGADNIAGFQIYNIFYRNSTAFSFITVGDDGAKTLLESYFGNKSFSGSWEGMVSASLADDICVFNKPLPNVPTLQPPLNYYFSADLTPSYASGSYRAFNIGIRPSEVTASLYSGSVTASLWDNVGAKSTWEFLGDEHINTNIRSNYSYTDDDGFTLGAWIYVSASTSSPNFEYTIFDKSDRSGVVLHDGFTIKLKGANFGGSVSAFAELTINNNVISFENSKSTNNIIEINQWVFVSWEISLKKLTQRYQRTVFGSTSAFTTSSITDNNIIPSNISSTETLQIGRFLGEGNVPSAFFNGKISSIFSYGEGFTDDDHKTIFEEAKAN